MYLNEIKDFRQWHLLANKWGKNMKYLEYFEDLMHLYEWAEDSTDPQFSEILEDLKNINGGYGRLFIKVFKGDKFPTFLMCQEKPNKRYSITPLMIQMARIEGGLIHEGRQIKDLNQW